MQTRNCEAQTIDLTNLLMEGDYNVRVTPWKYHQRYTSQSAWAGVIKDCLGNGLTSSTADYTISVTPNETADKQIISCKGNQIIFEITQRFPTPTPIRIQFVEPDYYSKRVWIIYPIKMLGHN